MTEVAGGRSRRTRRRTEAQRMPASLPRSPCPSSTSWSCEENASFYRSSVRKPCSFESLLLDAGLAVIADAVGKDDREARSFVVGKRHLVVARGDRLELALENIVARGTAGHRPRPRKRRI